MPFNISQKNEAAKKWRGDRPRKLCDRTKLFANFSESWSKLNSDLSPSGIELWDSHDDNKNKRSMGLS